jgi:hypothetical protein
MRSPLIRIAATLGVLLLCCFHALPQTPNYPKEIRGYKVERAAVEMKRDEDKKKDDKKNDNTAPTEPNPDTLIRFGEPRLAIPTPLGIRLEIPIVVAPVTQKGHVDFLMFEDMVVNGTPVRIDEYRREFDLPNKDDLVLDEPLRFTVNLPNAMLGVLGEVIDSKETWLVTGRVYVFGHYKKFIFTFKRTIPVELNLTIRNPLRKN